jgi:membrane-bound serine protease (ClpP class)
MEVWAFVLLGMSLVLILLEVFIPSGGLIGTVAAGCMVSGAVLAWKAGGNLFVVYLVLAFVLGPAVTFAGLKVFPHTPFGKALTLKGSSFQPHEAAAGGGGREYEDLVGRDGIADTPLRPAGKAVFEGRRVDVVTRGEMIDRGRTVRVVRVEGNRVFVAEAGLGGRS